MGPWPNSNEIMLSPPYSFQDFPTLAAKKLLINYNENLITFTQKYPEVSNYEAANTSKSEKITKNNNHNNNERKNHRKLSKKYPILSNLLSKNTLKSFFDLKLAQTSSDLDLDQFPIGNFEDEIINEPPEIKITKVTGNAVTNFEENQVTTKNEPEIEITKVVSGNSAITIAEK